MVGLEQLHLTVKSVTDTQGNTYAIAVAATPAPAMPRRSCTTPEHRRGRGGANTVTSPSATRSPTLTYASSSTAASPPAMRWTRASVPAQRHGAEQRRARDHQRQRSAGGGQLHRRRLCCRGQRLHAAARDQPGQRPGGRPRGNRHWQLQRHLDSGAIELVGHAAGRLPRASSTSTGSGIAYVQNASQVPVSAATVSVKYAAAQAPAI